VQLGGESGGLASAGGARGGIARQVTRASGSKSSKYCVYCTNGQVGIPVCLGPAQLVQDRLLAGQTPAS
jgi:hypothetical protein